MRLFLNIKKDDKILKIVQITKKETSIGKTKGDIIIPHPYLSHKHLNIKIEKNNIIIRDLDTDKGTFINEKRIENEYIMGINESIALGPYKLSFFLETGKSITSKEQNNSTEERSKIRYFENTFIPHSFNLKSLK